jgi:surface polysaccharide O-acyltransferase-like enzyme
VFSENALYFTSINSPLVLISSISLFLIFENFNIYNKTINFISKTTLGIYIIHDNKIIREYLWNEIFNNNQLFKFELVLHSFASTLVVFITLALIDLLQKATLGKIYDKFSERIPMINNKIKL